MVTPNRSSQSFGVERREFLAIGYLRTEPVVLSTVFRWAFSQNRGRNRADVPRCDPTHSIRAPEHRKAVIADLHELRDLLHEHVWMDVRPRDAACLDVGFDQLVPNDMWICAIPMAEHSAVTRIWTVAGSRFWCSPINRPIWPLPPRIRAVVFWSSVIFLSRLVVFPILSNR